MFTAVDIVGFDLIVAATDDPRSCCRRRGAARVGAIPINVVDDPALCSFIFPPSSIALRC